MEIAVVKLLSFTENQILINIMLKICYTSFTLNRVWRTEKIMEFLLDKKI